MSVSEITKSTSSSGKSKSPNMSYAVLGACEDQSNLFSLPKKTSMDIEEQYGFNFRDSKVQMLVRRPRIINNNESKQYKDEKAFMKPAKCPGCNSLVLRDPSVVDNNVVCPNEKCEKEFCWICLKQTGREEENINHFDDRNYLECSGRQFYDVREKSKLQVCCERFRMLLCIPLISIYATSQSSILAIHKHTSFCLSGLNKYLKWFILILFVYIYLIPVTLIFSGLIVGTLYGILSCLSQIRITFKICCRNITCCCCALKKSESYDQRRGNSRADILQQFDDKNDNDIIQIESQTTSVMTSNGTSVYQNPESDS